MLKRERGEETANLFGISYEKCLMREKSRIGGTSAAKLVTLKQAGMSHGNLATRGPPCTPWAFANPGK